MKSTKNYEQFKDIASNREVDERHVKKLVKAIQEKNLLPVNPILISKEMKVIDGQHRLEAARILDLPIYYIQGDFDRRDISKLNSNHKNWSAMDYINFYTVEKIPEFIIFSKFAAKHRRFKVTSLLALMSEFTIRPSHGLKRGEISVIDQERAEHVCQICNDLYEKYGYDFVYDGTFSIALKKAMMIEGFDLEYLLMKISDAPRAFVPCRNMKEYLQMIKDVYNYKLSKNRI